MPRRKSVNRKKCIAFLLVDSPSLICTLNSICDEICAGGPQSPGADPFSLMWKKSRAMYCAKQVAYEEATEVLLLF